MRSKTELSGRQPYRRVDAPAHGHAYAGKAGHAFIPADQRLDGPGGPGDSGGPSDPSVPVDPVGSGGTGSPSRPSGPGGPGNPADSRDTDAASASSSPGAPSHPSSPGTSDETRLTQQQLAFGYTSEELTVILRPMAEDAKEPVGSMGDDTALAVLSSQPGPSTTTSNSASPR